MAGNESQLTLTIEPGHVGVRHEVDGRLTGVQGGVVTVRRRDSYATLVGLAEEESRLSRLRERRLVLDSPRTLVRAIPEAV